LRRKLRWFDSFRSICGTVPLGVAIKTKEKYGLISDECLGIVYPQVNLHLILFSCLREGVATGVESSRHWKHAMPPDFRTMLFIGHSLTRERKSKGAENSNAQILSAVETLNESKTELQPLIMPFGVSPLRHFHNGILAVVQDAKNHVQGGEAAAARRSVGEMGLQNHTSSSGMYYLDSGSTTTDSLVINQSQMVNLIDISKGMLDLMGLPYSLRPYWVNKQTVKRVEFKTLGKAIGLTDEDDLASRETKSAVFLRANMPLLAMALQQTSSNGLLWDDDVVTAISHVLAVDERPTGSTRVGVRV
jgi:hypothetical protein